ncbi:hypothetical protein IFM89_004371 [Coptis chinensis]|uniref:Uncharacterized protein n=1 Tax=Coptis chinensis TaxID=261450 RepID=A0A835M796_9MAGN|nr:hypothetical protein IFM89_004371 [Coptis chinensis]
MGFVLLSFQVWPTIKPFVNGGASGMLATCVIQPVDMIKVRIQLGQGSPLGAKNMVREEAWALYKVDCSASYSYWAGGKEVCTVFQEYKTGYKFDGGKNKKTKRTTP